MKILRTVSFVAMIVALMVFSVSCEKHDFSFTVMPETQQFKQEAVYTPRKIDVLWVIDNSDSMKSSQEKLTEKFQSFISNFEHLKFDFHMAITTTDAWRGHFFPTLKSYLKFKDGTDFTSHSGVFVMDNTLPNLEGTFLINASQGTFGSGDERAFSSFQYALECSATDCPENASFRRPEAFLAIMILSDEDDFSSLTSTYLNNNYNSANLEPVDTYVDFLKTYAGEDNFSVNTISITDGDCLNQLLNEFPNRRIGSRYIELAQKTNGTVTSLCSDFTETLKNVSDTIMLGLSKYTFDRAPIPESITVTVDGVKIPNDPEEGWTYDPDTLILQFAYRAIPLAGSDVSIHFDPIAPKN